MLKPPSLKEIPLYPVTASLSGAAVVVTLLWRAKQLPDTFFMTGEVWSKWELWRAFSCTLPHADIFHLAFNLYWTWTFGTLVERVFGHFRFAAIVLLLALGSSLAEFTLLNGGVGLSGVGYGLWGLLWVLEKHDARFSDAVDQRTSQLFIGWFFFCIVTTVFNLMLVANIAHGVGAITGALLGFAISGEARLKQASRISLVMLMLLILSGAMVFWPYVNLGGYAEPEVERAGLDALDHNDSAHAIKFLELSTKMNHAPARAWYNLGVAYQHAHRTADAVAAYEHAAQMPDADQEMRQAAQDFESFNTLLQTNTSAP